MGVPTSLWWCLEYILCKITATSFWSWYINCSFQLWTNPDPNADPRKHPKVDQESCDLNHMTIPAPFHTLYFFTSKLGKTLYRVIEGISDFLPHFLHFLSHFCIVCPCLNTSCPSFDTSCPILHCSHAMALFSAWDEGCAKMPWCHMICLD